MDLKAIEHLIKLCRKHGVTEFTGDGFSLKLGDEPAKKKQLSNQVNEQSSDEEVPDQYADFPNEILSEEQLSYYAQGGKVGDEPWKTN